MANFRNVSQESLTIPRATGPITVAPGEVFIGSNKLLTPLVASGHLEPVPDADPVPLALPEPEPVKRRGRKAEAGTGGGDIDHTDS